MIRLLIDLVYAIFQLVVFFGIIAGLVIWYYVRKRRRRKKV